jgi:ComF family protein
MILARAAQITYDSLLALLYPQPCAICGASVESQSLGIACARCWDQTTIFTGTETLCWKCGVPSSGIPAPLKRDEVRCRRCDDDAFSAARACGFYEGALKETVLNLKREPYLHSKVLELMLSTHHRFPLNQATLIIPVPLHAERQKSRGFNQAVLLGQALAAATSLPFDDVSLVRTQHTNRHRAGMDALGRRSSVAKAFDVAYPGRIAGERVLLVDDVFTSGATVSSCAKRLLEAGAAEVFVLTLARPHRYDY